MAKEKQLTTFTILLGSFVARDEAGEKITKRVGDVIELDDEEAAQHVATGALVAGVPAKTEDTAQESVNVSALKGQVTKAKNALADAETRALAAEAGQAKAERALDLLAELDDENVKTALEEVATQIANELAAAAQAEADTAANT